MTVARSGRHEGSLMTVIRETSPGSDEVGVELAQTSGTIRENLTIGADLASVVLLQANEFMSFQGVIPIGDGFRLSRSDLEQLQLQADNLPSVVRPFAIGRDIVQNPVEKYIIDFFRVERG